MTDIKTADKSARVAFPPRVETTGLPSSRLFSVSKDIRRLELDEQGNVVNQESMPIGQRVRDVRQGSDGFVYVLTDEPNGQLLRLEPINN